MENNIVSLDNFRLKKIEQKHKSTRGFHLKERKKKLYLTEKEGKRQIKQCIIKAGI